MALKLYNTFTNKKETFKPIHTGKVGIYTCGPTVYGFIHIGNIRSYLSSDVLRRYLDFSGYEVKHIKNITDVGHLTDDDIAQGDSGKDKLIEKSKIEKKTPEEIARFYENYFKETEKEMNILSAHYFPRATAHIPQMIKVIGDLVSMGYAYEKNGNVFFDIKKFKKYGKLSGNTLKNLKLGIRLAKHPDKKNHWDFALWLKAPKEHLMKWESPWGIGYPGWHIECSAMSTEYLGETLDIHTGGEDNIFPHHEAEIAQTECWTGKKFVNYWVHNRHLLVNGEKMSKSKGNFYLLDDIKKKGFSAMDLRLLFLSSHYRSQVNFTWAAIKQAHKNLEKISKFIANIKTLKQKQTATTDQDKNTFDLSIYENQFKKAMDDDLNTPLALSVLYELISETNKRMANNNLLSTKAVKILLLWEKMNKVFGLKLLSSTSVEEIPTKIIELAKARQTARENKNWQEADKLRDELKEKGYEIKDIEDRYEITKV